jgi:WD40 repeat protein
MSDENKKEEPRVQADNSSIAVGAISAGGNIGDISINTGYSVEQVSVLITQISATFQPRPFDGRCPYKGLDVFKVEDAELFFGREKLVNDLVSRIKDSRTIFITGPSGSGKSSLVRAGLLHALKQGAIKDSERWLYATMKPGRDPISGLGRVVSSWANSTNAEDEICAKALMDTTIFARWCEIALKEGREKRTVLFIDQFEEIFTQTSNEPERVAFLNLLTHAAAVENGRVIILFSMRSDFVSNCATYPQLNTLLNQQFVQIGAMQPEELVSAIAQPALRVGLRIDPELIAQIINEMKGEPGALPLMQFALKDLFDSQGEKSGVIALTLNDYLQRGGIHKALERHADDSFSKLSINEQKLAHSIFSGLIEIGHGTLDTRRTALFDELIPANTKAEDVEAIVQKLADARLITTDEQAGKHTITISHEKLIDAWPWLKKLVNENREMIALQNEVAEAAKEWDDHKRDASYLYTGGRLANVQEQAASHNLTLNEKSSEFIRRGVLKEKKALSTRALGISLIGGLIVASALIVSYITSTNANKLAEQSRVFAVTQQAIAREAQSSADTARQQANIARANELAAQAISVQNTDFDLSMLLSVKAFSTADTPQTQEQLLNSIMLNARLKSYFFNDTQFGSTSIPVTAQNNGLIAITDNAMHLIHIMDVNSGTQLRKISISLPISQMALSINNVIAYGTVKSTVLWSIEKNNLIGLIPVQDPDIILFSPDGSTVITAKDNYISTWEVSNNPKAIDTFDSHLTTIYSIKVSPNGGKIAWNGCVRDSTYSCTSSYIFLEDLVHHQAADTEKIELPVTATDLAFTDDGDTLVLTDLGNDTVSIWNIKSKKVINQFVLNPYLKNRSYISEILSPDGKFLATSFCARINTRLGNCEQAGIQIWDLDSNLPVGDALMGIGKQSFSPLGFSPDNSILFVDGESSVTAWKTIPSPSSSLTHQFAADVTVAGVAYESNGTTIKLVIENNRISIWDIASNKQISLLLDNYTGMGYPYSVSLSDDKETIAISDNSGEAIVWSTITYKPTMILKDIATNTPVILNRSGDHLITADQEHNLNLWNTQTGKIIARYPGYVGLTSGAFSPDGKTLAIYSWMREGLTLIDTGTFQEIGSLSGSYFQSNSITFSPDGKTLFSGNADGSITLFDVTSLRTSGTLPASPGEQSTRYISVSPDGKELLALGGNSITRWNLDPESWSSSICQLAGRNLSSQEVRQYLRNETFGVVCQNWSIHPTFITEKVLPILSDGANQNRVHDAIEQATNMITSDFDETEKTTQAQSLVMTIITKQLSFQLGMPGFTNFNIAVIWAQNAETIKIKDEYLAVIVNSLCLDASLSNQAPQALTLCDIAIEMFPEIFDFYDNRGLARALTGDYKGAVSDFEYYVEHTTDDKAISIRKQWINELKAGNNPFTPDVLESLRSQ